MFRKISKNDRYRSLSDEELVKTYKEGESITRKEVWSELLDRHLGLIEGLFYEEFGWLGSEKEDLFNSTYKLALEREILQKWEEPKGMSVKNWVVHHLVYWLPGDTEFRKKHEEQDKHWRSLPGEELEEVKNKSPFSEPPTKESNSERYDYVRGSKKEAFEFLDEALTDPDSSLAAERKEGRKQVLEVLKENAEKGLEGIKTDGEKSEETDMTKSSFSMRKIRALDDLKEELGKRDFPVGIIAHFGKILNYRIDTLMARGKELKEDSQLNGKQKKL